MRMIVGRFAGQTNAPTFLPPTIAAPLIPTEQPKPAAASSNFQKLQTIPRSELRDEHGYSAVLFGGRRYADELLVVPKD